MAQSRTSPLTRRAKYAPKAKDPVTASREVQHPQLGKLQGQEAWTFVTGGIAEDGIADKAVKGMVDGSASAKALSTASRSRCIATLRSARRGIVCVPLSNTCRSTERSSSLFFPFQDRKHYLHHHFKNSFFLPPMLLHVPNGTKIIV